MTNINEILDNIGFTKGETKVYLALLELGTSTTGAMIEKSGISASKVYGILSKLVKKGLISTITKEKTKYFTVQDPKRLIDFMEEQEKTIKNNIFSIEKIIPELLLKKSLGAKEPIVQVFEGKKGFISAYDKIMDELEKGGRYYALATGPVSKIFFHFLKEFNFKRQAKNVFSWVIYREESWPMGKEKALERTKRKGYYPKICPNEVFIPTNIALANDSCVMTMVGDEIISIFIKNKSMVEGFKKYFEYVWSISKTPEGYNEYKGSLF